MPSLRLLGGASIEGEQGPLDGPATQRHRLALLALLAVAHPTGLRREKLAGYLWPERSGRRARNLLSQAVHAVRKAAGRGAVVSSGDELRLDAEILPADVVAFDAAISAGEHERAAALHAGPFLDGFFLPDAPAFERWAERERRRLRRAYRGALEELATAAASRGDRRAAVEWWRRVGAVDPYSGRVTLRLMEALEVAGDRAAALEQARIHARLIEEELGAEPDPAIEALAERIRKEPRARSGRGAHRGETPPGAAAPPTEGSPTVPEVGTDADAPADGVPGPGRRFGRGVALAAALALAALLAGRWLARGPPPTDDPALPGLADDARTIAVLPLEPLGGGPDVETLASGIQSDLITALSKLGRFRVISRNSTLLYRPGERSLRRIGTELGADLIVEGDVRGGGDRVRVNVRLTEVRTGRLLWGDNLDRRLTVRDIFTLETSITERIAAALERSLTPTERERIAAPPTERLSAYQFYHQAGQAFDGTRTGNREQVRLLRRALEVDPSFAQAWATLGVTYAWRPLWTGFPVSAWDSAVAFGRRALEEDPGNATGLLALSDVFGNQGLQGRAIRTARRALELSPNDALAYHRLGRPLHERGDFVQGLRFLRGAARLSPNNTTFRAWVGHVYLDVGDFATARRWYGSALALDRTAWQGLEGMGWLHLLRGSRDSALTYADRLATEHPEHPGPLAAAGMISLFARDLPRANGLLRRVVELAPDAPVHGRSTSLVRTMLGFLRLRAGDTAAADTLLGGSRDFVDGMIAMGATAPRWPYETAQIQAARGRQEEALDWLERAHGAGFRWAWMLERNPLLDAVRESPRFRGLVARTRADVETMRRRIVELEGRD